MKLAVTGADGFLGWHVRCRAFALGLECVPLRRHMMADPDRLAATMRDADAVLHCAGTNRGTDREVTEGNLLAAHQLAEALQKAGHPVRVVYANSIHACGNTAYGIAKRKAGELLAGTSSGRAGLSDVRLPNLFGEHGRPHYNSFVATFCHEIAAGREVEVTDREVPLLHVQDAADALIREASANGHRFVEPDAPPVRVSALLCLLKEFEQVYATGEIPDITGHLRSRLFNTYRSYLFPTRYPIAASPRTDARGTLIECVRASTTGGQSFASSTVPQAVRGEHVHLRKFERFTVLDGEAEISLRRLFSDEVVTFRVSGAEPVAVDMPTMWAHNLTNIGAKPLITFFWTNEVFQADDPDTFPCPVSAVEGAP